MRDSLLAPERTTTQCRETERTHRPDRRGGADAADLAGLGALGETDGAEIGLVADAALGSAEFSVVAIRVVGIGAVAALGDGSLTMAGGRTLSPPTVSTSAIVREAKLSVVAVTTRAVMVSASSGVVADGADTTADADGGVFFVCGRLAL